MKCALYPILQKLGRGGGRRRRTLWVAKGDFWIMATSSRASQKNFSLLFRHLCTIAIRHYFYHTASFWPEKNHLQFLFIFQRTLENISTWSQGPWFLGISSFESLLFGRWNWHCAIQVLKGEKKLLLLLSVLLQLARCISSQELWPLHRFLMNSIAQQ